MRLQEWTRRCGDYYETVTENFAVDEEQPTIQNIGGSVFSRSLIDREKHGKRVTCVTCCRCEKYDDDVDCGIVAGTNPSAPRKREIAKNRKRRRDACHVTNVLLMRCKPVILTTHHEVTHGRRRLLLRVPRRVFSEREAAVT